MRSTSPNDQYEIEAAKKDTITEIINETGVIKPRGITDVYSSATGIVEEVNIANGDTVQKGQKLMVVKSTASEQERQSASANYLAAQANLNAAQATANTLRADMYTKWKLFTDLASNDTYETSEGIPKNNERLSSEFQAMQDTWAAAEKRYKDQQTAIAAAQAQAAATRLAYQSTHDATIYAPTNGIVANLSVAPGDSITALSGVLPVSSSSQGITSIRPALSVTKDELLEMIVQIGQTDISKIQQDQTVTIYPDAQKTKEYTGKVARVDSIGSNVGGVVKYNVYIELTEDNTNLKSGMTGDIDIQTAQLDDVLTVPNSAVRPYKGGRAVRVIKKGQKEPEFIPVEIGLRGKERTQIIQGIDEGQEIIVSVKNEAKKNSGFLF